MGFGYSNYKMYHMIAIKRLYNTFLIEDDQLFVWVASCYGIKELKIKLIQRARTFTFNPFLNIKGATKLVSRRSSLPTNLCCSLSINKVIV